MTINLIIWEFRCGTPVFGLMMAFVFQLIGEFFLKTIILTLILYL